MSGIGRRQDQQARRSRRGESGMALLAVLGILTVLAIIALAFALELRFEEIAARSYARTGSAGASAQAGFYAGASELRRDAYGPDGVPFTGDELNREDSVFNLWNIGKIHRLSPSVVYGYRLMAYPPGNGASMDAGRYPVGHDFLFADRDLGGRVRFRMGVDEDPPGDWSVQMGIDAIEAPGLAGVDDDQDGLTDEDSLGRQPGEPGYNNDLRFDDDEDGLADEDGFDLVFVSRSPLLLGNPAAGVYELHLDRDNDRTGIWDESGKIDVNRAGNYFGPWRGQSGLRLHTYNDGVTPAELDLGMFIYAVLHQFGYSLAEADNLATAIVAYRYGLGSGGGSPQPGEDFFDDNGNSRPQIPDFDDNNNNIVDDPEEVYIGPTIEQYPARYVPGNRLDDDGDGFTDEDATDDPRGVQEGMDEPAEFLVARALGNDNPFDTLEEVRLVPGMDRELNIPDGQDNNGDGVIDEPGEDVFTVFQVLSPFMTIYSTARDHGPRTGPLSLRLRLNRLDNPELFYSLAIDNDGDWTPYPRITGDGSTVPSSDINGNFWPDGNWDSEADPVFQGGDPYLYDYDYDRWIGDTGDHNDDGLIAYDPEPQVNEDGPYNAAFKVNSGWTSAPGIEDTDDDLDGEADLDDLEVKAAVDSMAVGAHADGDVDGVDNDGDGLIDEIGETYIAAFDDDEDGRYDEDPFEYWVLRLRDYMDPIQEVEVGGDTYFLDALTRDHFALNTYRYPTIAYDPNVTNPDDMTEPNTGEDLYFDSTEWVEVRAEGCEGIRINEVMAEPYIRIPFAQVDVFNLLAGDGDDANCPPVIDSQWELTGGRYQVVESNRSCDPPPNPPRINAEERALFVFDDLPAGTFDIKLGFAEPVNAEDLNLTNPDHLTAIEELELVSGGVAVTMIGQASGTHTVVWKDVPVQGDLEVTISVYTDLSPPNTRIFVALDYIELVAEEAQYLELINVSADAIDLRDWQFQLIRNGTFLPAVSIDSATNPNTVIPPGGYAVISGDPDLVAEIYGVDFASLDDVIVLEVAPFLLSTYDESVIDASVVADTVINLFDADGSPIDSARVNVAFSPDQQGFEAWERADPTAGKLEWELEDEVLVTRTSWGDLYFKDAVIPADLADDYETRFKDAEWFWNPEMHPETDDYLCYTSPGVDGTDEEIDVEWVWENVRLREGEFRIRAYGFEGQPVAVFNRVSGDVNGATPAVTLSGDWIRNEAGPLVVDIPVAASGTILSVTMAPDNRGDSAITDFSAKKINIVSHRGKYLTGSPGEDNAAFNPLPGYFPAVKNGPLANPGELARVTTGEEFKRVGATAAAYLADYISTELGYDGFRYGLINVNTAPRVVLMALPWSEPGETNIDTRIEIHELCSWAVFAWARNYSHDGAMLIRPPVGPDGQPGIAGVDDDGDGFTDTDPNNAVNGMDMGELNAYGSDDGPFGDIGELLICLERTELPGGTRLMDRLQAIQPGISGERIFSRVSNLVTVRSDTFQIISRGRVLDIANPGAESSRELAQKRFMGVTSKGQF